MKTLILILFLAFCHDTVAQNDIPKDSSSLTLADTQVEIKPAIPVKPVRKKIPVDSLKRRRIMDSLLMAESTLKKDSNSISTSGTTANILVIDTPKIVARPTIVNRPIDLFYLKLLDNPFLRTKGEPIFLVINERKKTSKDDIFYLLSGLLLFLAFIKLVFNKYFTNLFRQFVQPSFRQKQTREQLQQGNLPSLLLNLFFVFSAAAYITFLLSYYQLVSTGFWLLLLYSSVSLIVLYSGKYIFLRFAGWVFNVKEATDAYIFAIYLINKIIGIMLIPFTLVMAFGQPELKNISITLSILLILSFFLYRYIISFAPVRREVKVSPLHFFLYVFALEITPLLLIYKTVMLYLD